MECVWPNQKLPSYRSLKLGSILEEVDGSSGTGAYGKPTKGSPMNGRNSRPMLTNIEDITFSTFMIIFIPQTPSELFLHSTSVLLYVKKYYMKTEFID